MADSRPFFVHPLVLLPALVLAVTSCGDDDAEADVDASTDCGGFGTLHDGHCDCVDGYQPAEGDGLTCIPVPIDDGVGDGEQNVGTGRLLVADGGSGRVVVVDLALGQAVATLATQGPARVYPSGDGTRGFAVQTSAGAVEGISPGITYFDHGDHWHPETSQPRLFAEAVVSCPKPIHFVTGQGRAAAFCDGDGMLYVFEDGGTAETFQLGVFDSGRPHHGVGLVAQDHVILSAPNPADEEDALPVGVRMLDFLGNERARFDQCPGLHGEASTAEHICFGCTDGVLCVHAKHGQPGRVKIQNPPSDTEDGPRVGRLAASSSSGVILGNWGPDLVRIDPLTGSLWPFPVGEPYLNFTLTDDGLQVLVLTLSGKLRKFDVQTGTELASVDVMPPFMLEPGHGQLRPNFIVGPNHAYVVDPRHPEVYELALDTLELSARTLALEPGQYHSLALVGLAPAWPLR